MKRTALIDADTIVYEATLSAEEEVEWEEGEHGLWSMWWNESEARAVFDSEIQRWIKAVKADDFILALSDGGPRWRNSVMETYKAKRKTVRRPMGYRVIREYCLGAYNAFMRPTLEGDDILGILATHPSLVKGEKVILSIDKDLKTIPGQHFNPDKDTDVRTVSIPEADYAHFTQTLTGDTTDGYPGVPGIGPKTAEKILAFYCTYREGVMEAFATEGAWAAIVREYEKAGLDVDDALANARVARICRAEDYDFRTKEVKLWSPQ